MRSREEWAFRIRQEVGNLAGLVSSVPAFPDPPSPLPFLPAPGAVDRAPIEALAGEILAHRFPLFDATLDTGPVIDWRRDYGAGISTGRLYFRFIPYLNRARVGDHKAIWELNRHQHLVVLAQAFRLTGRAEFLQEIESQLTSWLAANPYLRGMNWTSALEVAFRSLSWIWIYHLVGAELKPAVRRPFLRALYRHGQYLENNLSVYFSPNTHLLGEAVALHALGLLFGSTAWTESGAAWMQRTLDSQVRADGSHFEQSAYYHVYALDMFLFHYAIAKPGADYARRLKSMAGYLAALMGQSRTLPLLGDDDGGRFFHPYGPRDRFGRATLATCGVLFNEPAWTSDPVDLQEQAAWWLGSAALDAAPGQAPAPSSRFFPDSGVAVMACGDRQIVFDAGPFAGGHSHSDALALIVRLGEHELLIDPGTYTYVGDAGQRDWFRGSAAHNTIRIDGRDQATPAGPFRWAEPAAVTMNNWTTCAEYDYADATCRYGGFEHRRRVMFVKPGVVFILDQIGGEASETMLEQFWHFGHAMAQSARLVIPSGDEVEFTEGGDHGWRSRVFGQKEPAAVLRVWRKAALPAFLGAALVFDTAAVELTMEREDSGAVILTLRQGGEIRESVAFPAGSTPANIQRR